MKGRDLEQRIVAIALAIRTPAVAATDPRAAGAGTGRRHRTREECDVPRGLRSGNWLTLRQAQAHLKRAGHHDHPGGCASTHHRRAARRCATPVRGGGARRWALFGRIHAGGDGRRTAREVIIAAAQATEFNSSRLAPARPTAGAGAPERAGHHDDEGLARPRHHRCTLRRRDVAAITDGLCRADSRWRRRLPDGTRLRRRCGCSVPDKPTFHEMRVGRPVDVDRTSQDLSAKRHIRRCESVT